MKIPIIEGIIERRVLVNFTADPDIVQKIIPSPFRVKVYKGKAIVGICLIRLKHIRPKGFPKLLGIASENGAHRIAVEWRDNNEIEQGVFIPRRDTSSYLNSVAGGRMFPGRHHHARFNVKEAHGNYHIAFKSADGATVSIEGSKSDQLQPNSIFESLDDVSNFFEGGGIGYSPAGSKFDGLQLKTYNWKVEPLNITSLQSSFFEDKMHFPGGSVQFDNALLMTEIKHEWLSAGQKNACM